ncbi:MAG: DUF4292 domain-containing protein [Daejeonella sp.]
MKRNILNKAIIILFLLGVLAGCKAKKAVLSPAPLPSETTVTPPVENNGIDPKQDRLLAIKNRTTTFNTLSMKAKTGLSIGNNSNDVTMNIRIKNNEAIWVSVTAIAGLEVARALITPDSVKVLNKLENEYIKKPFSYLYEFTNNKINFGTLQAVLIGNLIPEFISESTDVTITAAQAELKSVIGPIMYNVLVNGQNNVVQTRLSDALAGQSLIATYGDFRLLSQQQFPHAMLMKSQAKNKSITLDLSFTKVELDVPVDMPFRVPERFLIKN